MPVTEANRRAKKKFDALNCIHFSMKLNKRTDADIIALLDSAESKQGLIRKALREYIANHEKEGEA